MARVVAIHQPNFFPWLGFFDKLARVDVFILMDNAQFQKKGGCWTNRVKLRVGGEARWVTAPVDRSYHGVLPISEVRIDEKTPWRDRLLRTIETEYRRSRFFSEVMPVVSPLVRFPCDELAAYNINAITGIARALGLDPARKLVVGSELGAEGSSTDLLISMVRKVDGTAYLCGGGASEYQQDEKFAEAGLDLVYQDYRHPEYEQHGAGAFLPGLSVLDALFECGSEETRRMLGVAREREGAEA